MQTAEGPLNHPNWAGSGGSPSNIQSNRPNATPTSILVARAPDVSKSMHDASSPILSSERINASLSPVPLSFHGVMIL